MSGNRSDLIKRLRQPSGFVYAITVSIFLHYIITGIVIVTFGLWILIKPKMRKAAFLHKSSFILVIFCVCTAVTALVCKNYTGLVCSFGALLVFVIGLYMRSVMTKKIYENCLSICCICAAAVTVFAVVERLINIKNPGYRCIVYFFNVNYLAAVMAAVVLICAYKVITRQGNIYYHYGIAVLCAVTMYLSSSLFVWIEVLIGVSVLLSLTRQHHLLSIFLIFVAVCGVMLYCAPEIFPRISESNLTTDNRILIWEYSLHHLSLSPVFGHGFLSYMHLTTLYPAAYFTTHAHNIILEPILSFGIVGSLIFSAFFFFYYRSVMLCKTLLRHSFITSLILSVTAAVLVHGLIDMTMMWIQTGLLYAVIMSGVGADEKVLDERRSRRLAAQINKA